MYIISLLVFLQYQFRKGKQINLELHLKAVLGHLSCLGIKFNQNHSTALSAGTLAQSSIPKQTQPVTNS